MDTQHLACILCGATSLDNTLRRVNPDTTEPPQYTCVDSDGCGARQERQRQAALTADLQREAEATAAWFTHPGIPLSASIAMLKENRAIVCREALGNLQELRRRKEQGQTGPAIERLEEDLAANTRNHCIMMLAEGVLERRMRAEAQEGAQRL